ncbi:MAG: type II toxin-antitoxin system YafQ family toxin [bacterium]|nr:type II toxin-antitoxin system YafQ family toxin [bacterium]
MRIVKDTKRFRREVKRLKKSGRRDIRKLKAVMEKLIKKEELSLLKNDHELKGDWKGFRDCHIEGDWVLIYKLGVDEEGNETITFHATDNHSNLF